jgi:hypothetical protein
MMNKTKALYAAIVLTIGLAFASAVYAEFALVGGGTGFGYGYGYGTGFGSDFGAASYRIDGGSLNNYGFGYGYVAPNVSTSGGSGGGASSGGGAIAYGGGYYNATTGTLTPVVTNNGLTCSPYFTQFMRLGKKNSVSEVKKLQAFLNTYEGANLPVTGYFGGLTASAVKKFQAKYTIAPKSGYVLAKTTAQLNQIYCAKVTK